MADVTVTRTMSAGHLNEVANHPEVRPFIGGPEGPLDLTAVVENPENYALVTEGGGWLLQPHLPGVYELHSLALPEVRGRKFFAAAQEAIRWMFTRTDCLELITKCPDDNPAARMMALKFGFRERFRRENAWEPGVGISYQAYTLDDFTFRDPMCLREGRAFHEALEAAKVAAGSILPVHPDDEAHDRAVGATVLMMRAGRVEKAVGAYNRWAIFSGYVPIRALSPTTIDVSDAVLEIVDGAMQVLLVRGAPPHE